MELQMDLKAKPVAVFMSCLALCLVAAAWLVLELSFDGLLLADEPTYSATPGRDPVSAADTSSAAHGTSAGYPLPQHLIGID